MSATIVIFGFVTILILIIISGIFSSSELAVFSLPNHRIDALSEMGTPATTALANLRGDPHRFLVTVLVSNNVANIAAASIATALLAMYYDPGIAATAGTVGISVSVIMLGELAPKSYAVANPENHALRMSRLVLTVQRVFWPVFWIFEAFTRALNHVTGGETNFESYLTREDIKTIVLSSADSGELDLEEGEMIHGVLDLEDTTVRATMVPRNRIASVSAESTLSEVIKTCWKQGVTRVPVYGESEDDIRGVIDIRDALRAQSEKKSITEVMTDPVFVPSMKPIDEVLAEMQAEGHRMVFAVDEFGTVVGLATLEDVIEEVIGELFDPEELDPIRVVDSDTAIVHGWATLQLINETLGVSLQTDGPFVTVAGLINHHFGRLAEEGDRVEFDDAILTVLDTSARRIRRIRIDRIDSESAVSQS